MGHKKIKAWIEAMRLRTLPVSVAGVIAGIACGLDTGKFRILPCIICLLFAIVAQIVSNFANEYYDYKNGFDKKGREGFRRGVTEGDISPISMKRATFALLAADCLLGASLITWGGWWLIPVGVAIALFAIGYSAGPYPLSHHGLGDVAVVVFFGIVPVMFTSYLTGGSWENAPISFGVGMAIGLLAANVLIVNNYRDMEDDSEVGKHTTVVLFGRRAMSGIYIFDSTVALIVISISILEIGASFLWIIGWGLIEIFYIFVWISMKKSEGKSLNLVLKKTAQLVLLTAILILVATATK